MKKTNGFDQESLECIRLAFQDWLQTETEDVCPAIKTVVLDIEPQEETFISPGSCVRIPFASPDGQVAGHIQVERSGRGVSGVFNISMVKIISLNTNASITGHLFQAPAFLSERTTA